MKEPSEKKKFPSEGFGDYMKEIIISKNDGGQRADKFLMKYFSKAPKGFVYKMLRKKRIKLNGGRAEGSEMLAEGDRIQMYLSDETMEGFREERKVKQSLSDVEVVYEDENIIAVNKPAGLLSHAESPDDSDTLIDRILAHLNRSGEYDPEKENSFVPALCNRLDRNTSGIVIAGKNAEALRQINEAVRLKDIKKYYKTLVCGAMERGGRLEGLYEKDRDANRARVGGSEGKLIATVYRPIRTNGKYTLAEVELITGKSHQIRVHLASVGFPIIGDVKYGIKAENDRFRKAAGVKRQMLHAYRMVFGGLKGDMEYLNGKTIEADVPEDFKRAENFIFSGK